jgi:hypothetical protein
MSEAEKRRQLLNGVYAEKRKEMQARKEKTNAIKVRGPHLRFALQT